VKVTYLGTASVLLEYGGLRIITDPVLDPPGRSYSFGPWYAPKSWFASTRDYAAPLSVAELGALDVALISHDQHADNLDEAGRQLLSSVPFVITNPRGARRLKATGLAAGESTSIDGVTITAVPARHGPRFTPQVSQVTGFLLAAAGEPTVWISGDTVLSPELRAALPTLRADVAIIHCGGVTFPKAPIFGRMVFTFDADHVVEAIGLLEPRVIIPVHRSGWAHFEPEADLRGAIKAAGLESRTRFLELGESTTV
jgi:L-ascorbate metabolism protein UlaG (beta-lactamase superfamily)